MSDPRPLPSLAALQRALDGDQAESDLREALLALLPLLDAVERLCRGLDRRPPAEVAARAEALSLLADLADQALARVGLERVGQPGESADPQRHRIEDTVPADGRAAGTVVEVMEHGWVFRGRLLRPARVVAVGRPLGTGR